MTDTPSARLAGGQPSVSRKHFSIAAIALVAMLLHGVLWLSPLDRLMDWAFVDRTRWWCTAGVRSAGQALAS